MAKPEPKEDEQGGAPQEAPKKASALISIAVVIVLSVVSVGLGYFMGQMIQGSSQPAKMASAKDGKTHDAAAGQKGKDQAGYGESLSHG